MLPVKDVGNPAEAVGEVEKAKSELPCPVEGVDEEDVPTEGHGGVQHNVGVLKVDSRVFDVITAV